MNRLFVDVDSTLILWDDDPMRTRESHQPNLSLIKAIEERKDEFDEIYVWSGGGGSYARMFGEKYLPFAWGTLSKDIRIPDVGDLCIDDMPIVTLGRTVTWQEFVGGLEDNSGLGDR